MQYEKEQLDQTLHRMQLDLEKRYSEELKHTRNDLDDAVSDRDSYKYQLNELQREHKRVGERLHALGGNYEALRQELDTVTQQRNRLRTEVGDLRKKLQTLQERESGLPEGEVDMENKRLKEINGQLREKLAAMEETRMRERDHSPVKSTLSRESLGHQSSDESMGKRSRGRSRLSQSSIDEDSLLPSGLHSTSISELTSLDHGSASSQENNGLYLSLPARRNLSASATNLSESPERGKRSSSDMAVQLQSHLMKEREKLARELTEAHQSQSKLESHVKSLQDELEVVRAELSKSHLEQSATREELQMIIKQKGVMIEKSTASFEQSAQLQTQLMELQTEKTLLEKQRDAASRERDRVVADATSLKKKLEIIKGQRQKDAKELAAMRRLRDRALQEHEEALKAAKDMKAGKECLESRFRKLAISLRLPASNDQGRPPAEGVSQAVEQLRSQQDEYHLLLRKLFGHENMERVNAEDAVAKVEGLFHDKSSLLEEIEGLQRSVHKQNEERIFELKQAMENLYMERDGLQSRNKALNTKASRLESERDKLRQECERLDRQCQEMNATLSSPTRIGDLWRDSLCPLWEQVSQVWEKVVSSCVSGR